MWAGLNEALSRRLYASYSVCFPFCVSPRMHCMGETLICLLRLLLYPPTHTYTHTPTHTHTHPHTHTHTHTHTHIHTHTARGMSGRPGQRRGGWT